LSPLESHTFDEGARFFSNASAALIDQAGEHMAGPAKPFQVVPEFRHVLRSVVATLKTALVWKRKARTGDSSRSHAW